MITAGRIFPYDVLPELMVTVTSIELADAAGAIKTIPPTAITNGRLPLHLLGADIPNWREASLSLECGVAAADLSRVATDGSSVDFVIALRDGATRSRWSTVGSRLPGAPRWVVTVSLARGALRGALEVYPYLVRREDASDSSSSQARHRGAVLGWAPPITVHVDESPAFTISGDVDVHWISFADDPLLRAMKDRMFDVDVLGTRPIVKLNKDHEDLRRAMINKSRQGAPAALRQALFCYIVQSAFMAIALDALEGARVATEDANGVASFPDLEWKADALRRVLRHLYRDLSPEKGLAKLLELYGDQSQLAHVVALLSSALQSTINVKKNLLRFLGGIQ